MMVIDEQADQLNYYWNELRARGVKLNLEYCAREVVAKYNALDYDVLLIDSTDNVHLHNWEIMSEYWKTKNPKLVVIGTSVQKEFLEEGLCKKIYDGAILFEQGMTNFGEKIIENLEKMELIQKKEAQN